jgi:hypothetical protein
MLRAIVLRLSLLHAATERLATVLLWIALAMSVLLNLT